ncbi:Uncharacterised protein [Klebsiella pneumoniae]|nr:Uncharacterised protein [Klebsiella pneumoniae]SWH63134.1 Uncharacterised protein [Klebsiella pneumoniae]VAS47446.1 Uncharacterised protein [Klebsiella pneumoniae]
MEEPCTVQKELALTLSELNQKKLYLATSPSFFWRGYS